MPVGVTPPNNLLISDYRGQSGAHGSDNYPLNPFVFSDFPSDTFGLLLSDQWCRPQIEPFGNTMPAYGGSANPTLWPANFWPSAGPATFAADMRCKIAATVPKVGSIMNARAGLSLAAQMPGSSFWDATQARTGAALAYGTLSALVFIGMQSDSKSQANAEAVSDNFLEYVEAYRTAWGNVPVIWTKLGEPPGGSFVYWSTVEAQQEIIEANLTNAIALPTKGVVTFDGAHFTTEGQRTLGTMIELARYALVNGAKSPPNA